MAGLEKLIGDLDYHVIIKISISLNFISLFIFIIPMKELPPLVENKYVLPFSKGKLD